MKQSLSNATRLWNRYLRTWSDSDYQAYLKAERAETNPAQLATLDRISERNYQNQQKGQSWQSDDLWPHVHNPL